MSRVRGICCSFVLGLTAVSTLLTSWPVFGLPCCCSATSLQATSDRAESKNQRPCCGASTAMLSSECEPTCPCCRAIPSPEKAASGCRCDFCHCGSPSDRHAPDPSVPVRPGADHSMANGAAIADIFSPIDTPSAGDIFSCGRSPHPNCPMPIDLIISLLRFTC